MNDINQLAKSIVDKATKEKKTLSKEDDRLIKRCLPWLSKEKREKLLPKDITHLKELEKAAEDPGAMEDFEKLLERAAHTPPFPMKSSRASPKSIIVPDTKQLPEQLENNHTTISRKADISLEDIIKAIPRLRNEYPEFEINLSLALKK
jgi:hypothetical protein